MKFNGTKVRQIREELGMSLTDLALKSGLSISFLSEIETGAKKPSLRTAEKLAHTLNMPKASLFSVVETNENGDIGGKVKLLRQEKQWTLNRLAEKTGFSASYLSDIERGRVVPSVEAVKKIAEALEVPTNIIVDKSNTVGQKLKSLREEQGLTQGQLASMAEVSPGLIGQIESGKVQPSLTTLEKIAQALSISPCYFILNDAGTADMFAQMGPDLKELLSNKEVQSVLRLICHCNKEELQFILNFIKLYKQSRTSLLAEEEKVNAKL
ncbi:MAG: helix-turn-helix transcriptional regulator [Bacillota bacterium]